ncbi:SDR family oxidoreductase [Streptomyces exfoliatus]|uniref:SDR family oxidoreductase n=1 Tax=Streptomyces exfoliatus TaxID=1905 RepID=UPI003C30C15C
MTEQPILITGGTGKVGGRAVAQLGAKGVAVRVGSRSGDPRFDWVDRSTWDAALDGVKKVFVVPQDGEQLTRPFVRRAKELGVERIVLLSGRGADVPGYAKEDSIAGRTHIDGEDAVHNSGLEWTVVRPAWFAQNFSEGFFRDSVIGGELRLPAGDGAASFVDALIAEGWPEADAEDYADSVGPIRRDMDSHLSDGVQTALGRPPRSFVLFVKEAAAAGAWRD